MRRALAVTAMLLAGCDDGGTDDATTAACADWDALQEQAGSTEDAEAVERLRAIADRATNANVSDKAIDLAILLEGVATQTEVHEAFLDMDAACAAATD